MFWILTFNSPLKIAADDIPKYCCFFLLFFWENKAWLSQKNIKNRIMSSAVIVSGTFWVKIWSAAILVRFENMFSWKIFFFFFLSLKWQLIWSKLYFHNQSETICTHYGQIWSNYWHWRLNVHAVSCHNQTMHKLLLLILMKECCIVF